MRHDVSRSSDQLRNKSPEEPIEVYPDVEVVHLVSDGGELDLFEWDAVRPVRADSSSQSVL